MWGSESTAGSMALLRVPLADFGDGRGAAQREHYRRVPAVQGYAVQNRFVGDWLLYGGAHGRGFEAGASAYASAKAAASLIIWPASATSASEPAHRPNPASTPA